MKRSSFWLWTAVVFQSLTAAIHSIALFSSPQPQNDTEEQLFKLMTTYKADMGGGFNPSTYELMTALSSCFTLLYLFGALVTGYLLRKKVSAGILKGIVGLSVIIFGICFGIMFFLTFLPPIILTGIVFLFLTISYFMIKPETR